MNTPNKRQRSKVAQKNKEFRDQLWPGLDETKLWNRKKQGGFTTIPRTMPLIMAIMDAMSNGRPVSHTYFDIWCRAFDESFITLDKAKEMAFYAGFYGQRAESTWKNRLKILKELKFIDFKPGPSGDMSYALIWNPHLVINNHWENKTVGFTEYLWNALVQRATQIGNNDFKFIRTTS